MADRKAKGIIAGVALAGIGAALAAERAIVARDRSRPDPEAREAFGALPLREIAGVRGFDGTPLHVVETGSGPTIVLVHGFSLDHSTWHYQLRDLAPGFRLVAYDHRGHGRSGRPDSDDAMSLEALARDLDVVVRAACPPGEQVVVAGHSMGGMAALTYAGLFPDEIGTRVGGLVLACTTAADVMGGMLPGAARRLRAAFQMLQEGGMRLAAARPAAIERAWGFSGDLSYLGVRLMGFGPRPSPAQVAYIESLLERVPADVLVPFMRSMLALDVTKVCEAIDVPVLVVAGTSDRLTPPGAAERTARAIPGAQLAVIHGAGHTAMMEKPHAFNARVRTFLTRIPAFRPGAA